MHQTRFEKEVHDNSEMAYYKALKFLSYEFLKINFLGFLLIFAHVLFGDKEAELIFCNLNQSPIAIG